MDPAVFGYIRVSQAEGESGLATQRRILTDVASGRTMNRPGWRDLNGPCPIRRHHRRRAPGEHRHQRRQRRGEVLPALIRPLAPSSLPLRILVMPLAGVIRLGSSRPPPPPPLDISMHAPG